MAAVWMRTRGELRARLASVLSLALIVGVLGGVVIAAAAGARRTESAYPRFFETEHGMDVVADAYSPDLQQGRRILRRAERLPQVIASSLVTQVQGHLKIPGKRKPGDVFGVVSPDGRFGTTVNGVKILEGRMYDPNAPDEIVPSFVIADVLGLHVGETVQLVSGGVFTDQPRPGSPLAPVALHVVGIGAFPNAFQPLAGGYFPIVLFSPGFYRAHHDFIGTRDISAAIRLRHGAADASAFRDEVRKIRDTLPEHSRISIPFNGAQQTVGVQQTTRIQAIALWVLAVLVAVAGLAIFGQALARQTFLESIEYPTLRSIGMSPQQLLVVGMIRAGVIGVIGGLVAAVVGFLLSPLTPTGTARIAEPHPGFALDWVVVALGALGTILFVVLLSAVPAWRASRVAGTAEGTAEPRRSRRPSAVAGFLARSAFPPSATAGVRMAFEPGRGRTAVPVRTTIFGATLGLLALAAALGFGASLDRLVTTPGLSGWNWDAIMFSGGDDPKASAAANTLLDRTLDRSRQISAYSLGTIVDARVGTQGVLAVAMEPQRGSVTPSLVEGRLPRGPDEVALGSETMSEVGLGIGDTAPISGGGGDFRMRVVGRVVIPNFFFSFNRPGQGAVLSLAGADRVSPEENQGGRAVYVRFAPGIDQDAFLRGLKHRIPQLFVVPHQTSDQISSLNQVGNVPLILAGIIAFMAAATLGHTLITSIRRRRLDLAILKTLGFERRQISATVAWQATALAVVALGIGIPSGVVAGRWGWNVFADHLGVVPQAVVPVLAVLLALPVTIVVANLLAVIPGRIASRLKAAPVLRSE